MKKIRLFILCGLFCLPSVVNAQKIYIAEQYEFMGVPDQFGFSTLLRLYFEKYNYNAVVAPQTDHLSIKQKLNTNDYAVQVQRKSNMFNTRIVIELVNLQGVVVLKSTEGTSHEKEFRYANIEALRGAMDPFMELKNHTFLSNATNSNPASLSDAPHLAVSEVASTTGVESERYWQAQTLSEATIGLMKSSSKTPEMVLYKTRSRDCFIVQSKDENKGVLLYQNQKWYWEYYENNRFISVEIFIKGL